MSNLVFPRFSGQTTDIQRSSAQYDVNIKRSRSRVEQRVVYESIPLFSWTITIAFLRSTKTIFVLDNSGNIQFTGTEISALLWFIDQHKGQWDTFLFNDPLLIQNGTTVATPVISSIGTATGVLPSGTYAYRVTATTGQGETAPSTELTFAAYGPGAGCVVNWGAVTGATGYNIYGRSAGIEQFIASVGPGVTSYTDTGSITPYGTLPQVRVRLEMDAVDLDQVTGITGMYSVKTLKVISVKN